jgi:PAS domain-containing protein
LAAGAYINVTGHKNLEAGFQRIADNLAAGIFHVTDKEVFTFCNRTFRDWHDVNESVHRSGDHFLRDIVNSYTYGQMHPHIDKILRQESVREKDVYEDAAGRFIEADYRPDTEGDSEGPKGVFVLLTDVTRRESLYESTRMISSKGAPKSRYCAYQSKARGNQHILHALLPRCHGR